MQKIPRDRKMAPIKPKSGKAVKAKKQAEAAKILEKQQRLIQREQARRQFKADVEKELQFLKKYPDANSMERKKAVAERKAANKLTRKTERQYQGPLPITDEIRAKEKLRLAGLRKKYKSADANWSRVRDEANFQFKKWINQQLKEKLERATEDLNFELAELDVACLLLEEKILERNKLLEWGRSFVSDADFVKYYE